MKTTNSTVKPAKKIARPSKKQVLKKELGEKTHAHVGRPKKQQEEKNILHPKAVAEESKIIQKEESLKKDRYFFATGRRKTAVANIRMFQGKGENLVNKKAANLYFNYTHYLEEIEKPFDLTGMSKNYFFVASVSGGGMHAQAGAVRHGIATALAKISDDYRKVLKKNGLLTRDDRKKERKKPGLKRARRSPQWAKR